MVRRDSRTVGRRAEHEAEAFLAARGLVPIMRNFGCRLGEIDLVLRDGTCLVFVEVRYRAGRKLARARFSVDHRKQMKLVRTAAMFLARNPQYSSFAVRFDVVAIEVDERGHQSTDWVRDAFRPTDSTL